MGVALLALVLVALLAGPGPAGIGALVLAAAVLAALAWAAVTQIVAPLRRLLHAAELATAGDLTVRAQAENAVEIDELAAGFNALVATLERQRDELVSALDAGSRALGAAEAELAHRREAARVKDELIATVSEELRAPLTTMRGFLELALTGGELSADQRRFVTASLRNSESLLRVVEDLLLIAQIEAGELQLDRAAVEILDLAAVAVEEARAHADEEGVGLLLDTRGVPTVNGDRERLAELLRTLLANAIDLTPRGGRVELVAEARDGGVVLTVVHVGTPRHRQVPFFGTARADRARVLAEGLAIPIATGIAAAHGGTVAVTETAVRVELPS